MSNLFNMARVEAQDSSGDVLAGAKLEFFQTGTSTKLDTYSDDGLTTANANPVVADAAGRWAAIFLRDEDYKVTLSDSGDVQIWTADPVRGGVDNFADDTFRSTLDTTGSGATYALTVNRVITAYANGDLFVAKANFANTGAATLNIKGAQTGASALGAKPIKKHHDLALTKDDIESGMWCIFKYDGTNFQLLNPISRSVGHVNVLDYGAVGDGSNDDTASIQAAIDAIPAVGGVVFLPPGNYKITSALTWKVNVSMYGTGGESSLITADNCNAIDLAALTDGFQYITLENFGINGTNGTTRTAIIHSGTTDAADELYGVYLHNLYITNFNVGISFRTVRNFEIVGCWIQHVRQGINLVGKNLVGRLDRNTLVFGNGNGSGTLRGLFLNTFAYSTGGTVGPEGIQVSESQFFGFDYGIVPKFVNYINLNSNDIKANIYGIEFTTVQNGFNIRDHFIQMDGTGALIGIYGHGLASVISVLINIEGNHILGSGSPTALNGIQINDSGNQNQNHVIITGNTMKGCTDRDIEINNGGHTTIHDNYCESSGTTYSIDILTPVLPYIFCFNNHCAKTINTVDASAIAGNTITFKNIVSGTLKSHADAIDFDEDGSWTPDDQSGAMLTFTSVSGTYSKRGNTVIARCAFTIPSTADTSGSLIGGLPYTVKNSDESARQGFITHTTIGLTLHVLPTANAKTFTFRDTSGVIKLNDALDGGVYYVTLIYTVA